MPKNSGAGQLYQRVAFDKEVTGSDGYGGTTTGRAERLQCQAGYTYHRGGENVMVARLEARDSIVIPVRASDSRPSGGSRHGRHSERTRHSASCRSQALFPASHPLSAYWRAAIPARSRYRVRSARNRADTCRHLSQIPACVLRRRLIWLWSGSGVREALAYEQAYPIKPDANNAVPTVESDARSFPVVRRSGFRASRFH